MKKQKLADEVNPCKCGSQPNMVVDEHKTKVGKTVMIDCPGCICHVGKEVKGRAIKADKMEEDRNKGQSVEEAKDILISEWNARDDLSV